MEFGYKLKNYFTSPEKITELLLSSVLFFSAPIYAANKASDSTKGICEAHLTRHYPAPELYEVTLSSKNGIFLRPKKTNAKIDLQSPVISDMDQIWDLNKFKTGRAPVWIGPAPSSDIFMINKNIKVADLPIKMIGSTNDYRIPAELAQFRDLIQKIINIEHSLLTASQIKKYYAYLTIHQSYVEQGSSQRRLGNHVDGFQGVSIEKKKEVNHSYLVSNLTPTVFYTNSFDFSKLTEGIHDYYLEMDMQGLESHTFRTQPFQIYLMDGYSVHRADVAQESGFRTFVRISYEREKFDRKGNTHNPLFDYNWVMTTRPSRPPFLRSDFTSDELLDWLGSPNVTAERIMQFIMLDASLNSNQQAQVFKEVQILKKITQGSQDDQVSGRAILHGVLKHFDADQKQTLLRKWRFGQHDNL